MFSKVYKDPPPVISKIAKKYVDINYNSLVVSSLELMPVADRTWQLEDDLTDITYQDQKLANPFPQEECRKNPVFLFRRPFVVEISDGRVVGPNAAAATSGGRIIADSLRYPARHNEIHGNVARAIFSKSHINSQLRKQPSNELHLSSAAVLHRDTESTAYYHWIIDKLLSLRSIRHYERQTNSRVTIILPEHAPEIVYKILDYTGFGDNEVILWDEQPIRVENLVVPSWPEPTPKNIEWLRDRVRENINEDNIRDCILTICNEYDYIYISRQKSSRRVVTNYDEISEILLTHNIKPVYFEDLTLEEEIVLMESIDGVVSPHGAGLTSIIWSGELSVFEIFNGVVIPPFFIIADVLGHDYTAILGESRGDHRKRDKNIYVDPSKFEDNLEDFIS